MFKKFSVVFSFIFICLCFMCCAYASQLRDPIGRLGKNIQVEVYTPANSSFEVLYPVKQEKSEKNESKKDKTSKKDSDNLKKSDTETISFYNKQKEPNFFKDEETERIVKEISDELDLDRETMLGDLRELWVAAVEKSDTIRFAIIKLSNPNGEEVNKSGFKKIVEPILSAAPLVGQGLANPAAAAGSLIGSGVLSSILSDNSELNSKLTKVNDADLVILAKAIDDLQQNLIVNYMNYIGAYKEYEYSIKITAERQKKYEELNKTNSSNLLLANTFYTEALDNQYKARQNFLMKRIVLEQMVGNDALLQVEKRLNPKDS